MSEEARAIPSAHEQEEYFLRERDCFAARKHLEDFERFAEALKRCERLLRPGEEERLVEATLMRLGEALAQAELRWELFLAEHSHKAFRVFAPDKIIDARSDDVHPYYFSEKRDDERWGEGGRT